jgi:hypothetical protein
VHIWFGNIFYLNRYIARITASLGLPFVAAPGLEADDVIAALVAAAEKASLEHSKSENGSRRMGNDRDSSSSADLLTEYDRRQRVNDEQFRSALEAIRSLCGDSSRAIDSTPPNDGSVPPSSTLSFERRAAIERMLITITDTEEEIDSVAESASAPDTTNSNLHHRNYPLSIKSAPTVPPFAGPISEVWVVSIDKDLTQLVSPRTRLVHPSALSAAGALKSATFAQPGSYFSGNHGGGGSGGGVQSEEEKERDRVSAAFRAQFSLGVALTDSDVALANAATEEMRATTTEESAEACASAGGADRAVSAPTALPKSPFAFTAPPSSLPPLLANTAVAHFASANSDTEPASPFITTKTTASSADASAAAASTSTAVVNASSASTSASASDGRFVLDAELVTDEARVLTKMGVAPQQVQKQLLRLQAFIFLRMLATLFKFCDGCVSLARGS